MQGMRRKDREITNMEEILAIVKKAKVCRVAMSDGEWPYVVPLNFGFSYEGGKLTLYFHSAGEGKKVAILRRNPKVCVELDVPGALQTGEVACDFSCFYESVIGFGEACFLESMEEKRVGLGRLMEHVTGSDSFPYSEAAIDRVTVFAVELREVAGKRK